MEHKYIYYLHKGDEESGIFYCERFPVVYENGEVVYFKRNGSNFLDYSLKNRVFKNTKEALQKAISAYFYTFEVEEEDLKEFSSLFEERRKKTKATLLKNEYFKVKSIMLKAAEDYYKLTGEDIDPENVDLYKNFFESFKGEE